MRTKKYELAEQDMPRQWFTNTTFIDHQLPQELMTHVLKDIALPKPKRIAKGIIHD